MYPNQVEDSSPPNQHVSLSLPVVLFIHPDGDIGRRDVWTDG